MQYTPLHDEHVADGGKVVDFHGWALPIQFTGILDEHAHTRTKASVFDCSHMAEFTIRGRDAIQAYSGLVCSDVEKIVPGRGRYGMMLNDSGGIIDDLITIKLAEDELYVVTNAGPAARVAERICGGNPGAEDVSAHTAKIDIQGPLSREILVGEGIAEAGSLKYFQACRAAWRGTELIVSRTGYTGELGYELFVANEAAPALWRALRAHDAVRPAGLGARDTLRTEMGYLLSGQDFDESRTPLEAGAESFVAWDTPFTGRDALLEQRERGGYPLLSGIRTGDRRAPRPGFAICLGDESVGTVTSGTYGPSVGHGIGLAYLQQDVAAPGTGLNAGPKHIAVETARPPFYGQGTCRT
ncbi:MAG: glycine cleavage system aminomethyltransferase GcvT [Candidatus Hydrogenedentes bacterium]|nr:glycine cleavage system aminomethyltransferase GcvT [Candidatus Hydrogenedentota bacterium]